MKVKIVSECETKMGTLRIGGVWEARKFPVPFGPNKYQILEGTCCGEIISELSCIELPEQDRDNKLVVLPVKVAEAVEYFRGCGNYTNSDFPRKLFYMAVNRDDNKHTVAIKEFATKSENQDLLLEALVNGYTVETLESKIKAAVLNVINSCSEENEGYIVVEHNTEIARRITEAVAQIIREDGAAG